MERNLTILHRFAFSHNHIDYHCQGLPNVGLVFGRLLVRRSAFVSCECIEGQVSPSCLSILHALIKPMTFSAGHRSRTTSRITGAEIERTIEAVIDHHEFGSAAESG